MVLLLSRNTKMKISATFWFYIVGFDKLVKTRRKSRGLRSSKEINHAMVF